MTKPQSQFISFLLMDTRHYLARKKNFKGRPGYMIYLPKQRPQRWFQANAVNRFIKQGILKADGIDFYKADRRRIRSLHGNSWIKRMYKQTLFEETVI